jgi:hypothetical protein
VIVVRHISASGCLNDGWESLADGRIDARVRRGSLVLHITFAICLKERPRFGSHPVMRHGDDAWLVLPERYCRCWPNGIERLFPIKCPIADLLAPGEQLVLSSTPESVCKEIEAS